MKFANIKYFNSDDLKKLGFHKVGQNCHISDRQPGISAVGAPHGTLQTKYTGSIAKLDSKHGI